MAYKSGENQFAAKSEQNTASNKTDANQEVQQRRNGILKANTSQSGRNNKLN
ncbi:hypothetical protein ACLEUK_21570 [Pseudescherichia vulneris]